MNNSILRVEHGASAAVISVLQNMMKVGRIDYSIEHETVQVNEITGKRTYSKQQRVKEYNTLHVIEALESYLEEIEDSNLIVTRNVKKKASQALELMQSIA